MIDVDDFEAVLLCRITYFSKFSLAFLVALSATIVSTVETRKVKEGKSMERKPAHLQSNFGWSVIKKRLIV